MATTDTTREDAAKRKLPRKLYVDDGIILVKYWFSVSDAEQERRFEARIDDALKRLSKP